MRLVRWRRLSQVLALVLTALFAVPSCSSWQQTQALVARDNHYRQLRVWTVDGARTSYAIHGSVGTR